MNGTVFMFLCGSYISNIASSRMRESFVSHHPTSLSFQAFNIEMFCPLSMQLWRLKPSYRLLFLDWLRLCPKKSWIWTRLFWFLIDPHFPALSHFHYSVTQWNVRSCLFLCYDRNSDLPPPSWTNVSLAPGLWHIICSCRWCYFNWFWYLKISPPFPQCHSPSAFPCLTLLECDTGYLPVAFTPAYCSYWRRLCRY